MRNSIYLSISLILIVSTIIYITYDFDNEVSYSDEINHGSSDVASDLSVSQPKYQSISSEIVNCESILNSYNSKLPAAKSHLFKTIRSEYDDVSRDLVLFSITVALSAFDAHKFMTKNPLLKQMRKDRYSRLSGRESLPEYMELRFSGEDLRAILSSPKSEEIISTLQLFPQEVADFIKKGEWEATEVDRLLRRTTGLNMNFDEAANYQPINLLEVIIDNGNDQLLDLFIQNGGVIPLLNFGLNPLERLVLSDKQLKFVNKERMLDLFNQYGFQLRLSTKEQGSYIGSFGLKHPFSLTNEQLNRIREKGVQVLIDPPLEQYLSNTDVQRVSEEFTKILDEVLFDKNKTYTRKEFELCQSKRVNASEETRTVDARSLMSDLRLSYSGDQLLRELHKREPGLVNCQWSKERATHTNRTLINEKPRFYDEVAKRLFKEEIQSAAELRDKYEASEYENAQLFWYMPYDKPGVMTTMLENGFKPRKDDHFWAARLSSFAYKELLEFGFAFDYPSETRQSIVEYAARQCNSELLEFLSTTDVIYRYNELGEDALGIAMRAWGCRRKENSLADTLAAIMKFNPTIEEYHLKRMAEIRNSRPFDYERVIDKVPQLKIDDKLRSSGIRLYCSY